MKAILLAGGMGTRLRSVVTDVPKPMAPVCGIPFLEILLRNLVAQGINDITLAIGYRHEIIMDYFRDHFLGIPLHYVVEDTPLGTGGALKKAMRGRGWETPYFVLNADTFIEVDLSRMLQSYLVSGMDVGMVLKHLNDVSRYGRVTLNPEKTQIITFEEKSGHKTGLVNMGIYILYPGIFERFNFSGAFSLEKDMFLGELTHITFFPWITEGYFIDIGIPEDYQRAQSEMHSFL